MYCKRMSSGAVAIHSEYGLAHADFHLADAPFRGGLICCDMPMAYLQEIFMLTPDEVK